MNKIVANSINLAKNFQNLPKQLKLSIAGGIGLFIFIVITLCATASGYTGPDFYKYKNIKDKELYCLGHVSRIAQADKWAVSGNQYSEVLNTINATFYWYCEYYGIQIVTNSDGNINLSKTLTDKGQKIVMASDTYADYVYKQLDKNGECQEYNAQTEAIMEKYRKKYGEMYYASYDLQEELQDFRYRNNETYEKCQSNIQKMAQEQHKLDNECIQVYLDLQDKLKPYILEQQKKQEEQEIKSNYPEKKNCFAYWMPHGGMWQEQCYKSKKECETAREERVDMGSKINRSECYNVNYLGAYCINDILAGYNRYNDIDNTEYAVTTEVCTKDIEQCESFKKYQAKWSRSQCVRKIVADAEWEGSFLTSEEKINDIIKNNQKNNSDTCTEYLPAKNQQQAFEKLGLDWNRTKNWGAFVDENNILRANKPSCREIAKDSAEYQKYKK